MDPLLVPVQLDAFVLNPAVCGKDGDTNARIIPITQPNYTFLRLDNFVIQSDVQSHADVHAAAPAAVNPRLTDLGSGEPLRNRHGVYLHWRLPRVYRSGTAADNNQPTTTTPEYIEPPTRWIVIRHLDPNSIDPQDARPAFKEYQAWVIDSDFKWKLDDITDPEVDLQVDLSPFVVGAARSDGRDDDDEGDDVNIDEQAEVFIGRKTPLEDWNEETGPVDRPSISLLRSSNQLFADFQLHNGNVFSMLDNFAYLDKDKKRQYLKKAQANYYVLGWHFDKQDDPLFTATGKLKRSERVAKLFMSLADPTSKSVTDWDGSPDAARLVCHGAMYNVKWDHENKPANVPADKFAATLQNRTVPAVSVGTTPMDALITYIHSRRHKKAEAAAAAPAAPDSSAGAETAPDPDLIAKLEEDILAIDSLLHARDDGVEGQREAKETVYNWNYARFQGGTHYHLSGDDNSDRPTVPDDDTKRNLKILNQYQLQYDSCSRALEQYRWNMFSHWWKYVSDPSNKGSNTDDHTNRRYLDTSNALAAQITSLDKFMKEIKKEIGDILDPPVPINPPLPPNFKTGTLPFYYSGRDPTVLIGGVDSGWGDFLDPASVRVLGQTIEVDAADVPAGLIDLGTAMKKKILPGIFDRAIDLLLTEFYGLIPALAPDKAPPGKSFPQFHDTKAPDQRWRDQWGDTQPWFPLYFEWEAEYVQIPMKYWHLDQQTARLSDNALVRYGIKVDNDVPLYDELLKKDPKNPIVPPDPKDQKPLDIRRVSGRVLILPQPSFSLKAKVKQLFSDTPPEILEPYLPEKEEKKRTELLNGLDLLSYLSAPLAGLTDHLVTMSQGSHIKPENKTIGPDGEKVRAIIKAEFKKAGLTKDNIELIQGNSALTPYATMVDFPNHDLCPFKPATHGQLRFRKLNIIDKFGQALVAIDQKPRLEGPPPFFPAISDWFEPQVIGNDQTKANTVIRNEDGHCEFIQLPPQINQKVRLNADFVMTTDNDKWIDPTIITKAPWRPATEWEQPVFGWVVVNYADYGIQFFLQDGTFYREVRVGGQNGAVVSPKWMPFAPDNSIAGDNAQLDAMITKMHNEPDYLKAFWSMITSALHALPPAPSTYAQFLNSIVGKPLALVRMGWSLELDGPPFRNQSKIVPKNPNPALIKPPPEQGDPDLYSFAIKLGDKEREYDGLVGYFDMEDKDPKSIELEEIYTYWADKKHTKYLVEISTGNYPEFNAFWRPPFPETAGEKPLSAEAYDNYRNRELHTFGAIIDPFTPIHAWTSILPARSLQLPPWTWQQAMDKMTAFFHTGPLNVTTDVLDYDVNRPLTTKTMRVKPPVNVALPALGAADWIWLQPYDDKDAGVDGVPLFNSYGIENRGNILQPGFQPGPYTAIEGFLQLRNPIMKDKQ